jgi:hypothetical protein
MKNRNKHTAQLGLTLPFALIIGLSLPQPAESSLLINAASDSCLDNRTCVPEILESALYEELSPSEVLLRLSESPYEAQMFFAGKALIRDDAMWTDRMPSIRLGAARGNIEDYFLLGIAYLTGRDTPLRRPHRCHAAEQFYAAASQGDRGGQAALGLIYLADDQFLQDAPQSRKLFKLAFTFDSRPMLLTPAFNYIRAKELMLSILRDHSDVTPFVFNKSFACKSTDQ